MDKVRFIITKEGFRVDDAVSAEREVQSWTEQFEKTPYEALYSLAFRERPDCFDAAGIFLCQLAERFGGELTSVSGLELSRANTELAPSEESIEILLNSVPFMLGAEFVTKTWIKRQYRNRSTITPSPKTQALGKTPRA